MSSNQSGIFVRSSYDFKKDLRLKVSAVRDVKVCNGELVVLMPSSLVSLTLSQTHNLTDKLIDLHVPLMAPDELEKVHVSPSGRHAILSSAAGENFYVNIRSKTICPLKKVKGVVTAVGWNPDSSNADTGHILLGTATGGLMETSITSQGNVGYVKEHGWSGAEMKVPVSSIHLHVINDDDPKAAKWSLLICIPKRLYALQATLDVSPRPQFVGSTSLNAGWVVVPEKEPHVFAPFFSHKDLFHLQSQFDTPPQSSALCLHPDGKSQDRMKFVWMTGGGMTLGRIVLDAESSAAMVKEEDTVEHRRIEGSVECPIGISLTQYHILLSFPTRLTALSFYTKNVVYEDAWMREWGTCVGLSTDLSTGLHWLHTTNSLLKYRPNDEARYVWNVYLERGEYMKALSVARDRKQIDPDAYELVLRRQADKYMSEKNFGAAAEILAQSSEAFETIVLRLMNKEDEKKTGLKTLLDKKLEQLRDPEDRMKRDALFMWLLEMQLSEIADVRKDLLSNTLLKREELEEKLERLNRQIQAFLMRKNLQETIQKVKDAIYRMMMNHSDYESSLFLATSLKDIDEMVSIRIRREEYEEALSLLVSQSSPDLFYRFCPVLVPHIPQSVLSSLKKSSSVRPHKILPLLVEATHKPEEALHILSYLEWALSFPSAPQSLHNLLISLLARFRPQQLLPYFEQQGRDRTVIRYDLEFAIRTMKDYDEKRCLVWLYGVAEMWLESVQVALEDVGSVSLAKQMAESMDYSLDHSLIPSINTLSSTVAIETRKSVWLLIVQSMLKKGETAKDVLSVVSLSRDALKIHDILPLLPDFTRMEELKDPLVACLKEHSAKIQRLQQQMKDATETAQEMREKAEKMKKKVMVIKSSDTCETCHNPLFGSPLFVYACRHFFHTNCLHKEMAHFLSEQDIERLTSLTEKERRIITDLELGDGRGDNETGKEQIAVRIGVEIRELIGRQCPLCSELAIDQIDVPFITDDEYDAEVNSWKF